MLRVEFTSADPENAFDTITQANIPIAQVTQQDPLTYRIVIHRSDYRHLSALLLKKGDDLKIVKKRGVYWSVKQFLHRPVLVAFFTFLLLTSFYLPSRIFFITVEGNTAVPDRLILSAAEDCGIRFAASRKLVRSEKVKNALLSAVPQLQWAGVNTSGCRAVISVRERTEESPSQKEKIVSNLVAERDGFVLSTTITSGTAHVLPGQTVTKGQLLVSGYTDCGICIRAARAEGEILAQTNRKITAVMPENDYQTVSIPRKTRNISLLIGKKRINLWKDSSIFKAGCGRMYEEYYVSLPGGFQLPVAVCIDQYTDYELREAKVSREDAKQQLQQFSDGYLTQQMIAGQFLQTQHDFSCSDVLYKLESSYICTEMIGREQREQIGVFNGKRN